MRTAVVRFKFRLEVSFSPGFFAKNCRKIFSLQTCRLDQRLFIVLYKQ